MTPEVFADEGGPIDRDRLLALALESCDLYSVVDREGVVEYISPSAEALLGAAPQELTGRAFSELVDPLDHEILRRRLEAATDPGSRVRIDLRMRTRAGSTRWFDTTLINLVLDDRVRGIALIQRDITERKQAENEASVGSRHLGEDENK